MAAQKGNEYWRQRTKHGRDKLFAEPHLLMEAAQEYFVNADANPFYKFEYKIVSGKLKMTKVPLKIPYTIQGLCRYLGVTKDYFNLFKRELAAKAKPLSTIDQDYLGIIDQIEAICYEQKFNGASAGIFNASIIARDLGLVEKTLNENVNVNVEPSAEEAKRIRDAINDKI